MRLTMTWQSLVYSILYCIVNAKLFGNKLRDLKICHHPLPKFRILVETRRMALIIHTIEYYKIICK